MYNVVMNCGDIIHVDQSTAKELFFKIEENSNAFVSYFDNIHWPQGIHINPRNVDYIYKENEE